METVHDTNIALHVLDTTTLLIDPGNVVSLGFAFVPLLLGITPDAIQALLVRYSLDFVLQPSDFLQYRSTIIRKQ